MYARHEAALDDFWGRRHNRPRLMREFHVFGRPVRLSSNDEGVLAAGDLSRQLYSTAPAAAEPPLVVQFVVRDAPIDPGPVPDDLVRHIQYSGEGYWLAMQLGAWGHCQVDLAAGRALAVLTPQLAQQPETVSRCLLNTIFNNLFTARGLSMLHATCLWREGRALLLMAPHNSGKSTTALRLILTGYTLVSDSQVYVARDEAGIQLMGFPVGRIKLREDMLAEFPRLRPLWMTEQVREETKYTLDLRRLDPALVHAEAIRPSAVELCLLERSDDGRTRCAPATRTEVMEAVMVNSLHYDTADVWKRNLAPIGPLVDRARWHHLAMGAAPEGIVETIASLWT